MGSSLDSAGIPYMVTGSVAMAIYALPRMTRDIDLVIECEDADAVRIAQLFESDCYVDIESIRDAIARRSMFNIIHSQWVIKADFIVRKNDEYRKLEFRRRKRFDVEGASIWVVAPEDLVLSKLCWAKNSGSEIQQKDARAIIDSFPHLDWTYLETWAIRLGVKGLLDQVKQNE